MLIDRKIKILIDKTAITVGRVRQNPRHDVELGGRDIEPNQAILELVDQKNVRLLSQGQHVYVNGEKLSKGEKRQLANGDVVVFGWNSVFMFKNPNNKVEMDEVDDSIDWYFVKRMMDQEVDIDQSDTE
jgi:hypothetical protein